MLPVDPARYGAFLAVMAVMAITPGPANLFSIANGVARGRAGALAGVAGMNTATLVWFAGAALGLAALTLAFPQVFRVLAIGGGLYVAWLGAQAFRRALGREAGPDGAAFIRPGRSAFRDGFTVQITNPKALLFFTVVLPPFLDAGRPIAPQLALFAAATITLDVVAMSAYGLFGAALSARMNQARFRRGFSIFSGALLVAAAVMILARA